jgi:Ca2+-binding RTX toxin-like protein
LFGGSGENTLKGGDGSDTFVIGEGDNTIKDFDVNDDAIEVPNNNYTISARGDDSELTLNRSGNVTLILGVDADTLSNSGVIQVS